MIDLSYNARKATAYTYPIRYYLQGEKRQQWFDFMQGDLKVALERLTDMYEKNNLMLKLDWDTNGNPIQGAKFREYKLSCVNLTKVVRTYFDNMIQEVTYGLPNCPKDNDEDGPAFDYTFDANSGGS